jgi:hypothetical protein
METQLEQFRFSRINWGGVWAGDFVGLGIQIVLMALGLGIGLMGIDPNATEPLTRLPVSVEVWSGLAWLFSAFMGAYVAAWLSGSFLRSQGIFHGMVTWGFLMSAFVFLATTTMGFLIGGSYGILAGIKGLAAAPSVETLDAMCWWLFAAGIVSLGFAYLGGRVGVLAAQESMGKEKMYRAA